MPLSRLSPPCFWEPSPGLSGTTRSPHPGTPSNRHPAKPTKSLNRPSRHPRQPIGVGCQRRPRPRANPGKPYFPLRPEGTPKASRLRRPKAQEWPQMHRQRCRPSLKKRRQNQPSLPPRAAPCPIRLRPRAKTPLPFRPLRPPPVPLRLPCPLPSPCRRNLAPQQRRRRQHPLKQAFEKPPERWSMRPPTRAEQRGSTRIFP